MHFFSETIYSTYVCKVFCPEAGPSLDMHYQDSTYLSLLDNREVVCQVLSSLSQWPYGNTFHCTHRHKNATNTTTKHPYRPTPNSSQTATAINGTEPSWELQNCFSLSEQTNATLMHPSYTATGYLLFYNK